MKLNRRAALLGSAALAGGAVMFKSDKSGPRAPYFLNVQAALKAAGIVTPALVIDRDRLDRNLAQLKQDIPADMAYRIVAKSLPSTKLLKYISTATDSKRMMTFNLPMLTQIAAEMPEADQFLGKPLSASAAKTFLDSTTGQSAHGPIHWLIDSPERLKEYDCVASAAGITMNIALELDIGLHRGGMQAGAELAAALDALENAQNLRLTGLMGYDPHLPSVPSLMGWQDRAIATAWGNYQLAKAQLRAHNMANFETLIFNGAGSPTYRLYKDTSVINEISAGSALVKPTDFDTELLTDFEPASFIATPLIKGPSSSPLPALERFDSLRKLIDRNQARTLFIHGGHWLAKPEDPPGLRYNSTFGRSSNQEMLTGGTKFNIAPDDFVFLRPTQSEAVFLQFGPILVYSGGEIVDQWESFLISA